MIYPDLDYKYERQIEVPLAKIYALKMRDKTQGKRVADIGGAESLYLGWLLDGGFETTVIDPCNWHENQEWEKFVNRKGFHVLQLSIHKYNIKPSQFDFALLISTLEHLGRGGYNYEERFENPEPTCFENIKVSFCFTTPCGKAHSYGEYGDRNYSQEELHDYLKNKKILEEKYFIAPDWKEVDYKDTENLRYGQIMGNGASAIAYMEIE